MIEVALLKNLNCTQNSIAYAAAIRIHGGSYV